MKEKYRQDPVDVHADAYVGYPGVQESIRNTGDDGGVGSVVAPHFFEVAA